MLRRLEKFIADLPPFPDAAREAAALLSTDSANGSRVVEILGKDPALAARVLRLANSPFYGCSGRISTLLEAFLVLGTRTLRQAVLAGAAMGALEWNQGAAHQWRHSTRTAMTARLLAEGRVDPDVASTAGLLHDLGRLVMDRCMEEEVAQVWRAAWEEGRPMDAAERQAFGIDHAAVGESVALRWRLPEPLIRAIGRHHSPDSGGEDLLVDLVHVADVVVHAFDQEKAMVPLVSERAWRQLGLHGDALQRLFHRMAREGGQ